MTDYSGQQFGDYRLLRYLGGGGFADVYQAEHIHLGTHAAVKLLKGTFTEQEKEGFRNEARLVAGLDHLGIVRLYTYSIARNIPYLAMSYAPGGSLDRLHPRGTNVSLSTIVSYVNQIADALEYAHSHKIIHRDIKPANFLLAEDGKVLLADFGIAVLLHRAESWVEQQVAGSYPYTAPEQFQGKAEPASDQYSLGIVVYQWLCGDLPFKGTIYSLPQQHAIVPPSSLRGRVPLFDYSIEEVVMRALAKDPQQRFPSIKDFARAFEKAFLDFGKRLEQEKSRIAAHNWKPDLQLQGSSRARTLEIVITGSDGSGKRTYFTSLIHELERWGAENHQHLQIECLTPEARISVGYDIHELFDYRRLLSDTQLPALHPFNGLMYPDTALVYEITFKEPSARQTKVVRLALYPLLVGECLHNAKYMIEYGEPLFRADGLIYLVNPGLMPTFESLIPGEVHKGYLENPWRLRTTHILDLFLQLAELEGLPINQIPVAIAISKSDIFQNYSTTPYTFLKLPRCPYDRNANQQDIQAIDAEVKGLLREAGQHRLLQITQPLNIRFFAISATGHNDDYRRGYYLAIEPLRCLDPLMWILSELSS